MNRLRPKPERSKLAVVVELRPRPRVAEASPGQPGDTLTPDELAAIRVQARRDVLLTSLERPRWVH